MTKRPSAAADLADSIRQAIEGGKLAPGQRLPTLDRLMEQHGVGKGTATRAVALLKADGLVESRGRGGTVVTDQMERDRLGTLVEWPSIHAAVRRMHDEIEGTYTPDVVLTMSGPGSFAAFLAMRHSIRMVPVLAAVTFPTSSRPMPAELAYRKAGRGSTLKRIETDKWSIYLPKALGNYPAGSRVVIFDDRTVSGSSQQAASVELQERGLEVRTAALVVPSEPPPVDYYGLVIEDNSYRMPWGSALGRHDRNH